MVKNRRYERLDQDTEDSYITNNTFSNIKKR